jgi:YVTN family beta-propeller protein
VITGCSTSTIFQPLGSNISSPNGIAIDATANRLYLVNSNSNVLYDWTQGSVQILDLTDPLHPKLMNTIATQSFSGEDVIDSNGRKLLYTTNRYSEQTTVTQDHLLIMNIDESSADFTTVSSVLTAKDPYGLFCCYPADRMWIATEGNELDFIDLATQTVGSVNLLQPISNGGTFSQSQTSFIAIKGNQAFLQRFNGGILILNLDTAADPTKNPIDYWIEDINNPTGVATDSTYLYVADQETIDGNWTPLLLVVDLSKLPPLTDNALTQVKQRDVDGLVVNQIQVARNPQRVFLTSQYAFVTCNDSDDQGFVSVIDLATKTRVTDIQVGKQPFGMALYAPGGVEKYLYVGNVESNTLSIIDIASLTVVGTYP